VLRSFYSTYMVFSEGAQPVKVRWFRCSPGALCYPGPHSFGSRDLDDDKSNPLIGEQKIGPRKWDAGMRPCRLLGNAEILGTRAEFEQGAIAFDRSAVYTQCQEPSNVVCHELIKPETDAPPGEYTFTPHCGGLRWAGESCPILIRDGQLNSVPACARRCKGYPVTMYAHVPAPSG
jgi:hypothetical protein